jgi:hypothetical protein
MPARALKSILSELRHPADRTLRRLIRLASGQRIVRGPFKGAKLLWPACHDAPYTLGTYELELAEVIERLIAAEFDHIIDIGAAAGVYVIGFAQRCPRAKVTAYEALPEMRETLLKNIQANGVEERVSIRGMCEPADLATNLNSAGRTLLIIDVEGYEIHLLDPQQVPGLQNATILVETHDFCVPDCTDHLRNRFATTHQVTTYTSRQRTLEDFPYRWMTHFGPPMRRAAIRQMCEYRPGTQQWLLLEPKSP